MSTYSNQQKGSVALIVLALILIAAVVGGGLWYWYSKNGTTPQPIQSYASPKPKVTSQPAASNYQNPFDASSSSQPSSNPFDSSSYQNPFEGLK